MCGFNNIINGVRINEGHSNSAYQFFFIINALIYFLQQVYSAKVRARAARERLRSTSFAPSETATLITSSSNNFTNQKFPQKIIKLSGEAIVFLLHNTLGYALMLSVMIYNGYIFITVVLSMGLGYFLFGHISMKTNMENMQARTTNVICAPVCSDGKFFLIVKIALLMKIKKKHLELPASSSGRSASANCELANDPTARKQMQGSSSSCDSNITDSCRL